MRLLRRVAAGCASILLLVGVAIVLLGVVARFDAGLPALTSGPDSSDDRLESFTPISTTFEDSALAGITLLYTSEVALTSGAMSGRVTALPDRNETACGEWLLEVDGIPRYLVCGGVPLWRPVSFGSRGEDVNQVIRFLAERGFEPGDADGTAGRRVDSAIRYYERSLGLRATGIFDPTWLIFGSGSLDNGSLTVAVGDILTAGQLIHRVPPRPEEVFVETAAEPAPGFVFQLGDTEVPLRVTGGQWQLDPGHPELALAAGPPDATLRATVDGRVKRAEALEAWSLPVAALVVSGVDTCVRLGGGPIPGEAVPVQVLTSDGLGALVVGELANVQVLRAMPGWSC